jgi:hypothetical protein
MQLQWRFLAGVLLAAAACKSGTEPTASYALCVHAQGAPFTPGAKGVDCAVPQLIRSGQTRIVELEADIYSGDDRTATVAVEFGPNGWILALGGSSIPVPGQQTLTIAVPDNAIPGDYQIAIRANSNGEQAILVFIVAVAAPI